MLEALKEVVFFMKTGSQKGKHFLAEIWQDFPLPDRNRNRKMEPDIRPEPDFAGYPVGSYNGLWSVELEVDLLIRMIEGKGWR